jgi:DNA-directed RNA polymerase beta' subunit
MTCGASLQDCAGHFGRIELCLPVYHVGYFSAVKNILERICKCCSRILLKETEREDLLLLLASPDLGSRQAARRDALKLSKRTKFRCVSCNAYNGAVKKITGMHKLVHEKYAKASKTAAAATTTVVGEVAASTTTTAAAAIPAAPASDGVAAASVVAEFHNAMVRHSDLVPLISKGAEDLNALHVYELLVRIDDDDCILLGLNPAISRPELLMLKSLIVPPVCLRPSLARDPSSGTTEDDLTVQLSSIVQFNELISRQLQPLHTTPLAVQLIKVQEQWNHLQNIVTQYINSDMPGVSEKAFAQRQYRRSLCQRLKGKQGRFRGNLSGKRVDFSGRTVISPDPNLGVHEVGIPIDVAKVMTYPARVFDRNIAQMRELVRRGADVHPGATHVRTDTGDRALRFADRERVAQQLKPGDVVMRHMQNGDVLLFNRQPSLHRVSIMAHMARVMPGRTFRFNECACTPFNADFDGDEMNVHLPQTEEARAEARELMAVTANLITPRTGDVLVAATQDFLSCAFLLSRRDRFFTRAQMTQMCWHMLGVEGRAERIVLHLPMPTVVRPVQLWTGKQLVEVMLCPNRAERARVNINLVAKTKTLSKRPKDDTAPWMCPRDGYLIVRDSQLLCGVLDKSVLGASGQKNNLFHVLLRDISPEDSARCMTRLARLCARYIGELGFSIGIDDVTPSPALAAQKGALVAKGYVECQSLIDQFNRGALPSQPGCSVEETLEAKLTGELGSLRQRAGEMCIEALPQYNSPLIMAQCGSKGSLINISQMIAIVGQQQVGGIRIQDGFDERTLPHFHRLSREPAAKGFVANSFNSGLTPTEFFFHTMGGREGLVDTAVKSVTGDTLVYVKRGADVQCVRIGDWIDGELAVEGRAIERHGAEQRNLELVRLADDDDACAVYMPTVDAAGAVTWGAVTALTRHDPGEVLYRVRTRGGRDVTVTASKSVLVYDEQSGAIREVEPTSLVPGKSRVPVLARLPAPPGPAPTVFRVDVSAHECAAPEQFALTREFGVFCGLYLAAGSADEAAGRIRVTGNDVAAVQLWFEAHDIESSVVVGDTGRAATVVGHSPLLARVLQRAFGGTDASKRLPAEFVGAPEPFVIGLLAGFAAGDGVVGERDVLFAAASLPLLLGLQMLAARFGAFGALASVVERGAQRHRLSFRGMFAQRVRDVVSAGEKCARTGASDALLNDVVLDTVASIEAVDVGAHRKVYDVTLPSTLNFGIANGLMVRDTAETGYLQRKMMKSLEDLSVQYDGSVRTSGGNVVQFEYGDDMLDPICMEMQQNPVDLERQFSRVIAHHPHRDERNLLPHALQRLTASFLSAAIALDGLSKRFAREVLLFVCGMPPPPGVEAVPGELLYAGAKAAPSLMAQMVRARTRNDLKSRHYDARQVHVALGWRIALRTDAGVAVEYDALDVDAPRGATPVPSDGIDSELVSACEVRCRSLDELELRTGPADYDADEAGVAERLCAKQMRVTPSQLLEFLRLVAGKHQRAHIEPGTAVGALAAQSIGEPATQMTLKSVDWPTPLAVVWRSVERAPPAPVDGPVGALIDALMAERAADVQLQADGVTEYLPLGAGEAIALSADERGRMRWTALEAVTRHPVVNADGSSTLMRVTLRSGRSVAVTRAKSILVVRGDRLVAIDGDALRIGDCVPCVADTAKLLLPAGAADDADDELDIRTVLGAAPSTQLPLKLRLTRAFGRFVGAYLAEGRATEKHVHVGRHADDVEWPATSLGIASSSSSSTGVRAVTTFHSACLARFMHAVCGSGAREMRMPAFALRANREFALGLLESYLSGAVAAASRSQQLRDGIATLLARFGTHSTVADDAADGATARPSYGLRVLRSGAPEVTADVALDAVVAIDDVEPTRDRVYDLTVAETRNMCTMSGVMLADTFHFAGVASMNVTLGVPRIKEILNAAKTITTPLITVRLVNEVDVSAARDVKNRLETTLVESVAEGVYSHVTHNNAFVDIRLDADVCVRLSLTAADIARALRRDTKLLKLVEPEDIGACGNLIVRIACGWEASPSDDKRASAAKKQEDRSISTKLRRVRTLVPTLAVCGVPSISRAVISKNDQGRHELLCEGTGLLAVAGKPGVRGSATRTNHIAEIFTALGIEATRTAIQQEVRGTVDAYGINIDPRHLTLLADLMTCKGEVLGISRFGIAKMKDSVLMLASFEKTTDHLFEAALRGKTDVINGVSDSIIMGVPMRVGTGMFRLLGRNKVHEEKAPVPLLSEF